jgi:hypothetical protein
MKQAPPDTIRELFPERITRLGMQRYLASRKHLDNGRDGLDSILSKLVCVPGLQGINSPPFLNHILRKLADLLQEETHIVD